MLGITKGQFSLLELARAVIAQTGPADVILSAWTVGIRDAEMAAWLIRSGEIKSFSFLVDHTFGVRQPTYCRRIQALFGDDSIVLSKIHAKFVTIRAGPWNVCLTGSMNLNRNPRWEHFTLWDSAPACDFLDGIRAELKSLLGSGVKYKTTEVEAAFDRAFAGEGDFEVDSISKLLDKADGKRVAAQAPSKPDLPDPSSIEIPASASAMLEAQYRLASVQEHGANQDHSWVAAGQFASLKVKLYRELMAARKAEGAGALTEAQFFAQLEERVGAMSTAHLEVAVREYLSRHPGMRLAGG